MLAFLPATYAMSRFTCFTVRNQKSPTFCRARKTLEEWMSPHDTLVSSFDVVATMPRESNVPGTQALFGCSSHRSTGHVARAGCGYLKHMLRE